MNAHEWGADLRVYVALRKRMGRAPTKDEYFDEVDAPSNDMVTKEDVTQAFANGWLVSPFARGFYSVLRILHSAFMSGR